MSRYHEKEAWEYAKLNIEGVEKVEVESIRGGVLHVETFLGKPYYVTRYFVGEDPQAKHGCVCEYKDFTFAPVNLEEFLPECFRFSPDGIFKLPRNL